MMKIHTGGIPPLVKTEVIPTPIGPLFVVLDVTLGDAQVVVDNEWGQHLADVLMDLKGPWEAWIVQGTDPMEAVEAVEETFAATQKQ